MLSYQLEKVCFVPYPSAKNDRNQWWVVFNINARGIIDANVDQSAFQEEFIENPPLLSDLGDFHPTNEGHGHDDTGGQEECEDYYSSDDDLCEDQEESGEDRSYDDFDDFDDDGSDDQMMTSDVTLNHVLVYN